MPERNVLPKPYVKPHPPMWVAAGNPGTFEKAAQLGLGVLCFTGGVAREDGAAVELYKKTIKDAEPVGEFVNDNVAVTTNFMCLERPRRGARAAHPLGQRSPAEPRVPLPRHVPEADGDPRVARRDPRPDARADREGLRDRREHRRHPDDCADALQKWEDIGVDQLIMGPSGSVFPHDLLEHTVKLFGDEVIPRFDKDPEHSTSRYRREAAERLGVK